MARTNLIILDEANAIIERFGLVRDEAALSAIEAAEALKAEQELQATSEPQKICS